MKFTFNFEIGSMNVNGTELTNIKCQFDSSMNVDEYSVVSDDTYHKTIELFTLMGLMPHSEEE